jgi:O-acetyl-ADP-ribose deacetylase (regulator of RNase III)
VAQFEQAWTIGGVQFRLLVGDIFDVPVEALVNSEQSDFLLARSPDTISGQLWCRFGSSLQDDLLSKTEGRVLPPGTVLTTTGQPGYRRIYHMGFHHPDVWLDSEEQTSQSEHVRVIGRSAREILQDFFESELDSIAFPLVGCGLFGLSPRLLARQFLDELETTVTQAAGDPRKSVWLVVSRDDLIPEVLNSIVQAIIDRSSLGDWTEPLDLGISYLDQFDRRVRRAGHPGWCAWMTTRHAELLTGFIMFVLAHAHDPQVWPENVLEPERPVPFGVLRERAVSLAMEAHTGYKEQSWPSFLAKLIHRDVKGSRRLEKINQDRNDIAHGRAHRPAEKIRADLVAFASKQDWLAFAEQRGAPDVENLYPWVSRSIKPNAALDRQTGTDLGVFERWDEKRWTYVVPASGRIFKVPRGFGKRLPN